MSLFFLSLLFVWQVLKTYGFGSSVGSRSLAPPLWSIDDGDTENDDLASRTSKDGDDVDVGQSSVSVQSMDSNGFTTDPEYLPKAFVITTGKNHTGYNLRRRRLVKPTTTRHEQLETWFGRTTTTARENAEDRESSDDGDRDSDCFLVEDEYSFYQKAQLLSDKSNDRLRRLRRVLSFKQLLIYEKSLRSRFCYVSEEHRSSANLIPAVPMIDHAVSMYGYRQSRQGNKHKHAVQ